MKGVIFGINPGARVIDLSHGVSPQDLMGAALVVGYSAPFFPPGTIHVAVVDPGVGSERRPILIESGGCFYIGPDNGILSLAVQEREAKQIVELTNEIYHLKPKSATFHGRDIFAPVAAYLSLGIGAEEFGPQVKDFVRLEWRAVVKTEEGLQGEIIYIDGFGNLITNIRERDLKPFEPKSLRVFLSGFTIHGLSPNYAGGDSQGYIALINSWHLLEISLFTRNAHISSSAKIGDPVKIQGSRGNFHG